MTKADQKRLDIIHRLPCLACVQSGGGQPNRTEAHHIVDRGYRRLSGGHNSTIPLCSWHHRGEPMNTTWALSEMTAISAVRWKEGIPLTWKMGDQVYAEADVTREFRANSGNTRCQK